MRTSASGIGVVILLCLVMILQQGSVDAQSIGRVLPKGDFEIGMANRYYHRNFSSGWPPSNDWTANTIYLDFGVTNWLALTAEGYDFKRPKANYPESDYKEFHLGVGVTAKISEIKSFHILAGVHYDENINEDLSVNRWDLADKNFIGSVVLQKRFSIKPVECDLFAGPTFVWSEFDNIPPPPFRIKRAVSTHNLGLSLGLDLVIFRHAHVALRAAYADYWQRSLEAGYIF